ncbi:MAG: hypothetical protein ACI9UV_000779 [Algoriphagus sp.]|jgi:hypothetical protein|tara:strand:+ start:299 stop:616 length:318 start_codon:yes stop_codon:yes gene_type:complete
MNYLKIIKYLYPARNLLIPRLLEFKKKTVSLLGYKLIRIVERVDLAKNLGSIADHASEQGKIEILKTFEAIGVMSYTDLVNSFMKSSDPKIAIQTVRNKSSWKSR